MVARVLMLLACGPLLQPTGFCVCQAATAARTPAGPKGFVSLAGTEPGTARGNPGCCSHRTARSSDAPSNDTAPPSCPDPDDDHMPGCPASPGVDRYKWVEPAAPLALALLPPTAVVMPLMADPVAHFPVITSAADRPSAPPLYLSHCSFVI